MVLGTRCKLVHHCRRRTGADIPRKAVGGRKVVDLALPRPDSVLLAVILLGGLGVVADPCHDLGAALPLDAKVPVLSEWRMSDCGDVAQAAEREEDENEKLHFCYQKISKKII